MALGCRALESMTVEEGEGVMVAGTLRGMSVDGVPGLGVSLG